MFDSDTFAGTAREAFRRKNARPSDMVKELDDISRRMRFRARRAAARCGSFHQPHHTILAVAAESGAFTEVEKWIERLDFRLQRRRMESITTSTS